MLIKSPCIPVRGDFYFHTSSLKKKYPSLANRLKFQKSKSDFCLKKVMFSLNQGNRYVVCLTGVDLHKGLTATLEKITTL